MSGHGRGYDVELDGPNDPRVRQWSRENTIIIAEEHLNHVDYDQAPHLEWMGMGTMFGRAYVATLATQRDVLLVPAADGGTALVDGEWSPTGGGALFEDAVQRLEDALASDEGNCVAAVLWHQGETDANRGASEEEYYSTLKLMIETLRDRVPRASKAPFILGEFTTAWAATKPVRAPPILDATRAIPSEVKFTAVASSETIATTNADVDPTQSIIHFDAAGLRQYAFLYFGKLSDANEND